MNTHRAYANADSTITCWVRDESSRCDLSGATLTVPVYAYRVPCPLLVLAGTGTAEGEVTFVVTQEHTRKYFPAGLYRFAVKDGDGQVYGGLLEVV